MLKRGLFPIIFLFLLSYQAYAAVCGNGICEVGETKDSCQEDCILRLGGHILASFTEDLSTLTELNVGIMRGNLPWTVVEPTKSGGFTWETIDGIVESSEANGIDIIFVLRSISDWGTVNPPKKTDMYTASSLPKDMERWKQFVTAVVNRYKDRGINIHYEVENEINGPAFWDGTTAEYTELLQASYAAIKQASPDTFVFASSLGCGISKDLSTPQKQQWLRDFLAADYSAIFSTHAFDGVSIHDYYFPNQEVNGFTFTSFIDFAENLMKDNGVGDKPIWVTEFGYISQPATAGSRTDRGSSENQAQWLSEAYDQALASGINRMFWIMLEDRSEGYFSSMGLMSTRGSKKPAFEVFAELNRGGTSPPVCGNGICEDGETEQNCPEDCEGNPGDVNGDGVVNIFDLVIVAQNFGKPDFNTRADVNNDGVVNIFDLVIVAQNFGT